MCRMCKKSHFEMKEIIIVGNIDQNSFIVQAKGSK